VGHAAVTATMLATSRQREHARAAVRTGAPARPSCTLRRRAMPAATAPVAAPPDRAPAPVPFVRQRAGRADVHRVISLS
jgi:hypothetical protein